MRTCFLVFVTSQQISKAQLKFRLIKDATRNCKSRKAFSGSEIRIKQTSSICSRGEYLTLTRRQSKRMKYPGLGQKQPKRRLFEHQVLHHLLVGDFPPGWFRSLGSRPRRRLSSSQQGDLQYSHS